jgi:ADP-ribosyl-[dinitrogen reductase] hydrolase
MIKTSATHPLRIDSVEIYPEKGKIGVTFAPGKKDAQALNGPWSRDLDADLDSIVAWGAKTVVTLIEPSEFDRLAIPDLGQKVRDRGIEWLHLPIRDVHTPGDTFAAAWPSASAGLRARLDAGENIVVHCRGGLGRAGMIAARLLVEAGVDPDAAIARVRAARGEGAIETKPQEAWVRTGPQSKPEPGSVHPVSSSGASAKTTAQRSPVAGSDHKQTDPHRDRAIGALVGLAIGDCLGTTIEFSRRDTYPPVTDMIGGGPFRLRPGEWTDDTSMALCLADSLIHSGGVLDPDDLARRFVKWWQDGENSVNGRCFDIGNATRAALASYVRTGAPRGDDHAHSAGNGGIMRLAPAALASPFDAGKAAALARAQSEVTHAAPECLDAADVLARVIVAGMAGDGLKALDAGSQAALVAPKIKAVAEGSWRKKSRDEIKSSGYVVDTLEAALWAVGGSGSFEEAVLKAVNLGDDADTVGAVAGQIAGALWGYSSIPARWRSRVAWGQKIVARAEALVSGPH